ncbi:MAG TPA: alcohol dehydrogenase catalytic domain-containing protein [Acidimicrobiia bacterium]|jgi:2-desacetyl-2-hydroxyethyl bacteriochlorophyllide A dehydrogenase
MDALPATMKAAVLRGKLDLTVEERPMPAVGPHDVLLEVSHCGVCGTDLHFVLEGWGGTRETIEGHEWSARVVAVGDQVDRWAPGDAVVGGPSPRCGVCEYCLAHRPSLCTGRGQFDGDAHGEYNGAFAEYVLAHERSIVAIPRGLALRAAALAEPLAVALHGLTQAEVRAGQRVLVTGAGPIGTLSVAALHAAGITDVVVSEPHPKRRALAERLGATTVDPSELAEPGYPGAVVDEPFDVALECSGRPDAMEAALGQLKRAGTLVLVGAGIEYPRLNTSRILLNELVVTGAFVYDHDGFERALELLARPDFPTDLLIEPGEVPLDGILTAIQGLGAGDLAGKVMIVPPTRGAA